MLSRWSGGRSVLLLAFAVEALVAQAQWHEVEESAPSSRFGAAFGYDAARGHVLLFGGNDGAPRDDTWTWDGSSWQQLSPATRPPARQQNRMAYDSIRQRLVMFGSPSGTGATETWVWDGSDWSQVATTQSPPTYSGFDIAFDPVRDRVVFWGGNGASSGNTWEFDGTDWAEIPPMLPRPSWNSSFRTIVYDPSVGRVSLYQPVFDSGMWRWDGATWALDSGAGLSSLFGGEMVYDSVGQRILLVGGSDSSTSERSLLAWNAVGNSWQTLATGGPDTVSHAAAFDQTRGAAVLVGGSAPGSSLDSSVWEWEGAGWQKRTDAVPNGRRDHTMAFDRDGDRLFLFGGRSSSSGDLGDLWVREQGQWRLLIPLPSGFPQPPHPGQLRDARLIYDEARDQLLLLGGDTGTFEFWRVENDQWQEVQVPLPPARANPAVVFDRARDRVVMFGGDGDDGMLNDTWVWNGVAWTELTPASSPPPRESGGMAYDARRDRIVLIGGLLSNGNGSPSETWEFDGGSWAQVQSSGPLLVQGQAVVYDEPRQAVVATRFQSGEVLQTWQWNGQLWTQIANAGGGLPAIANHTLTSTSAGVLLFGGNSTIGLPTVVSSRQYELRTAAPASFTAFGSAGSSSVGALDLVGGELLPWLGTTMTLTLAPLPPFSLPGTWVGLSRTSWMGAPLPIDLAPLGFPGNLLQISLDGPWPTLDLGDGSARVEVVIPNSTTLSGAELYAQGFVYEPLVGPITASNGLTIRFGTR